MKHVPIVGFTAIWPESTGPLARIIPTSDGADGSHKRDIATPKKGVRSEFPKRSFHAQGFGDDG
jgi:hypothetical protein